MYKNPVMKMDKLNELPDCYTVENKKIAKIA
jgi:hypothetical protein